MAKGSSTPYSAMRGGSTFRVASSSLTITNRKSWVTLGLPGSAGKEHGFPRPW